MILVGDIGGTNARFAIAMETDSKKIVISDYEKFKTREFKQFEELLEKFVVGIKHKPHKAILAVAGPVKDGKAKFCLLYTSPSPRDLSTSRMPSSA